MGSINIYKINKSDVKHAFKEIENTIIYLSIDSYNLRIFSLSCIIIINKLYHFRLHRNYLNFLLLPLTLRSLCLCGFFIIPM